MDLKILLICNIQTWHEIHDYSAYTMIIIFICNCCFDSFSF